MKCQQLLIGSVLVVLSMVGCGKKDSTSASAKPKPSTTIENKVSNVRKIDLSKITILSAQTRELDKGLSEVTGIYKGAINSVIPCELSKPIDLKKTLSGTMPIISLQDVVTTNGGISKGKINSFEIKRNNSHQSIIGLSLADNSGKIVLGQSENYSDTKADPAKCTQMLTESYKMHNLDGSATKRTLNIVSVLEGDVTTKTTTIVDDTRILAIQIEKMNGAAVEQYCVRDAKLVLENVKLANK